MTIAQHKIKIYLEKNEMTMSELARKIGVNRSTITRIVKDGMILNNRDVLRLVEMEIGIHNDWTMAAGGGRDYEIKYNV